MTIGEFSIIVSTAGAMPYVKAIIWGKVRPQRTTWFIWSLILGLGLWGYRASGANDSSWFIVGDLLVTTLIFMLSLWKGRGGHDKLDFICLLLAGLALCAWQMSQVAFFMLYGAIIADAIALVPTVAKALQDPMSEHPSTYAFSSLAAVCGVLAVGEWNIALLSYPSYLFLANITCSLVIIVSQYQVRRIIKASI